MILCVVRPTWLFVCRREDDRKRFLTVFASTGARGKKKAYQYSCVCRGSNSENCIVVCRACPSSAWRKSMQCHRGKGRGGGEGAGSGSGRDLWRWGGLADVLFFSGLFFVFFLFSPMDRIRIKRHMQAGWLSYEDSIFTPIIVSCAGSEGLFCPRVPRKTKGLAPFPV